MRRLLAILCMAAVNMLAAATEIRDTAYTAFNGVLFSGKLTITGPDMTTADGRTVTRWEQSYTITAGVISVDLEPNDTASPAGTSYLARFTPAKGSAWTERWIIPTSASPLKVYQVRVATVPTPTVTFPLTQLSPVGAVKGDLIGFGTSWGTFTGGENGQALLKDSTQPRGLRWGMAGQVSSVFGRTGAVTAASGDYSGFYAALSHVHLIADVTGLQTALDGKSATSHTHAALYAALSHAHLVADVTGLQTALDGKIGGAASVTTLGRMLRATGAGAAAEIPDLTWDSTNKRFKVAVNAGVYLEVGRRSGGGPYNLNLDFQPATDGGNTYINLFDTTGTRLTYFSYYPGASSWSLNNVAIAPTASVSVFMT